MYKMIKILMVFGLLSSGTANAISEADILGTWINQAGDGQIEISKQGEVYAGGIVGSTDPNSPVRKDVNNPNEELRDRSLIGLKILGQLFYRGDNQWSGGWIYDPNNGKTYKCKMTLKDSDTLDIRGYIGVSVFGRSEEWKRKAAE